MSTRSAAAEETAARPVPAKAATAASEALEQDKEEEERIEHKRLNKLKRQAKTAIVKGRLRRWILYLNGRVNRKRRKRQKK